jgi:hypothetical protein
MTERSTPIIGADIGGLSSSAHAVCIDESFALRAVFSICADAADEARIKVTAATAADVPDRLLYS